MTIWLALCIGFIIGWVIGAVVVFVKREQEFNYLCEGLDLMEKILRDLLNVTTLNNISEHDMRNAVHRAETAIQTIDEVRVKTGQEVDTRRY